MSSNEPLFGFDLTQKKSLAEFVAANGGGGDGTLGGLAVTPGFVTPLANNQLWVIVDAGSGLFVTNFDSETYVSGFITGYLETLPDYSASVAQTLQHDASGVIKWVDNA